MPINILSTANALRQRLFGDKIRLGDTEDTELQTKAQVQELVSGGGVPLNTDQFFTEGGVKSIKSLFIPETASTFDFSRFRDIGTLESPIVGNITVTRSGEYNNVVKVFFQSVEIPIQLGPSRPFWMIVTGDAYDPFAINELTFTYKKVHKDGTTSIQNAVVCEIVTHPSLNASLNLWFRKLIVNSDFNDNRALSATDTLQNFVPWSTADSNVQVENGTTITFTDLGGGNFAASTGATNTSAIAAILGADPRALLGAGAVTVIARVRSGSSTSARTIASNIDTVAKTGFAFYHNSDNRLRLEIGDQVTAERVSWPTNVEPEDNKWIDVAFTFKNGIGQIFARIEADSVPFGLKAIKTNFTFLNPNSGTSIRFDRTLAASNAQNWTEKDKAVIIADQVNASTILAVMNAATRQIAAREIEKYYHPVITVNLPTGGEQVGGYAGLYNGGLGVSGGEGGITREYSDFYRLLEDMATSDRDLREIYHYTGNDITLIPGNYQTTGVKNKSLQLRGQTVDLAQLNWTDCENIKLSNFRRTGTNDSTLGQIGFNNCVGVWCDRLTLDNEYNLNPATWSDELIAVVAQSDLVSITNCKMIGGRRAILIGQDAADNAAGGKLRVSIMYCDFLDNRERVPLARGAVHLANNLFNYDTTLAEPVNLGMAAMEGGRIYAENNYYESGHAVYRFETPGSNTGGILDVGSFRNNAGFVVAPASDLPYNSNLVTFVPSEITNYRFPIPLMTPAAARTWILANAGATLNPIV